MLPIAAILNLSQTNLAIAGALSVVILIPLFVWRTRRKATKKAQAAAAEDKPGAYTIILLRGGGPVGGILTNCVFVNGSYIIDPKGKNPILVPFDASFIKANAVKSKNGQYGQPFMHFDMESQLLVKYEGPDLEHVKTGDKIRTGRLVNFEGQAVNDHDVTVVHHDGVVQDLPKDEAAKLQQSEEPVEGKTTVYRKHASLWRRWPGSRIFAEKTTNDWNLVQQVVTGWLELLKLYGMPILIVLVIITLVVAIVAAVKA